MKIKKILDTLHLRVLFVLFVFKPTFLILSLSAAPAEAGQNEVIKRGEMARAILQEKNISPPISATGLEYQDVNTSNPNAAWIEQFKAENLTEGCGANKFCPDMVVTKGELAKIFLKAKFGSGFLPTPSANIFNDVPQGGFNEDWITELKDQGWSTGCDTNKFCPEQPVSLEWFQSLLALFSNTDADNDSILDSIDNCPTTPNPDQKNTDGDSQGDVCDADDDNDGLTDAEEATLGTNPLLADTDNDGVSDKQDDFPLDNTKVTTYAKAYRLLLQATFGPADADIQQVMSTGITAWVDGQLAKPSAYDNNTDAHKTHLERVIRIANAAEPSIDWSVGGVFNQAVASFNVDEYQMATWWENALGHPTRTLHGSDQLRQRVAYALSQILVVSNGEAPLHRRGESLAFYYDLLAKNAFGNYRTLLGEISRSPTMGVYLSHQGNRKTNLVAATNPDENFARELIQLFSIGLNELNLDGSPNRDNNPSSFPDTGTNLVATYTQQDITEMAKVMTGWDLVGNSSYGKVSNKQGDYTTFMEFTAGEHEDEVAEGGDGQVTIMGQTFALNSGADGSGMDAALDLLFQHPNIGPFISRHLIMRLVTSNPSSAYIARVANVFNNNGSGVKGDLKAVVRAILLDDEARLESNTQLSGYGKVKEPILALTQFLRAFKVKTLNGWISKDKVTPVNGVYWYKAPQKRFGQAPLRSPSVFNFYLPDFIPSDTTFAQNKWVAPELQIQTDQIVVELNNEINNIINNYEKNKIVTIDGKTLAAYAATKKFVHEHLFLINFDEELNIYEQALDGDTNKNFANMELINPATGIRYKDAAIDALLEHLNQLLLGGTMTNEYRAALKHYLMNAAGARNANDFKEAWLNIKDAVRLIVTSSAYMIQK